MHALKAAVGIVWIVFWAYWLFSALSAKQGTASRRRIPLNALTALSVFVLVREFRTGTLTVHSTILEVIGTAVLASGLALAVWARVYLGRNWGMPMTQKADPELVTSGPYRFVRHPIYAGLLMGLLGTALVINLVGLIIAALLGAYFDYSASVEERNLTAAFPNAYPAYRGTTKMLIPFVF